MLRNIKEVVGNSIATITQTPAEPLSTRPIPDLERQFRFHSFGDPQIERMLEQADLFCREMLAGQANAKNGGRWLTLLGATGTGKTHIAQGIERFFRESDLWLIRSGSWYDWRSCCDSMREGAYGCIDDMCEDWFAVIDDIGAEYDPSGFIASKLDRVLNTRQRKWTVLTSNYTLAQIGDKLDVRIASRMLRNGGKVVEVDTMDYNLRNV